MAVAARACRANSGGGGGGIVCEADAVVRARVCIYRLRRRVHASRATRRRAKWNTFHTRINKHILAHTSVTRPYNWPCLTHYYRRTGADTVEHRSVIIACAAVCCTISFVAHACHASSRLHTHRTRYSPVADMCSCSCVMYATVY